jgi:CMP-N-acetylneuraminic acid synthetase
MSLVVALIIGRKGSSFTNKNLVSLRGRPSVDWVARAGAASSEVDIRFTSSDSSEILEATSKWGYIPIERPVELSQADSRGCEVIEHALEIVSSDQVLKDAILVLQHANAPAVTGGLIDDCVKLLKLNVAASSVVPVALEQDKHPFRQKKLSKLGFLESHFPDLPGEVTSNRQSMPISYSLLHNIWVIRLQNGKLPRQGEPPWECLGPRPLPFELSHYPGDIHEVDDVPKIEEWLRREETLEKRFPAN